MQVYLYKPWHALHTFKRCMKCNEIIIQQSNNSLIVLWELQRRVNSSKMHPIAMFMREGILFSQKGHFLLGMPVPISLSCKMGNYILVALSFGPIEGLLKYNLKWMGAKGTSNLHGTLLAAFSAGKTFVLFTWPLLKLQKDTRIFLALWL